MELDYIIQGLLKQHPEYEVMKDGLITTTSQFNKLSRSQLYLALPSKRFGDWTWFTSPAIKMMPFYVTPFNDAFVVCTKDGRSRSWLGEPIIIGRDSVYLIQPARQGDKNTHPLVKLSLQPAGESHLQLPLLT